MRLGADIVSAVKFVHFCGLVELTVSLFFLTFISGSSATELVSERPNIVLIMPDDMGYGDIQFHGNPIIQTPNLDALARESFRFTDFHVSPTCAPTRSALMTGRHEFRNGITHTILERERLNLEATTLAEFLVSQGYQTGIFGKWHLGDEDAYLPEKRGFTETFIHGGGGIGQTYPGSCGDAPGNKYFNPSIWHNGKFVKTEGYCTDIFFRQATGWIDSQRQSNKPFFALITPNAPHGPLVSPGEQYEERYKNAMDNGKPLEPNVVKYYAMIANIDENVGRLLKQIDEWKLSDNTIVIFMCDNGGTFPQVFNAGYRGGKGTPYQGGTHSPLFVRWPKHFAGNQECNKLVAHIDIFPTLAELLGAELPKQLTSQIEGRSFAKLLKNPESAWEDRYFVTHVGRWDSGKAAGAKFTAMSIRNSDFSLVNNKELYDLRSDMKETENVIAQHPEIVAELRKKYDRWWDSVQPQLVNEDSVGPKLNPFKERFWKQFGGEANPELLKEMDPARKWTWPK